MEVRFMCSNEINENSYSANIWTATGKPLTVLENRVKELVQEEFINTIRPTKEQVDKWKASNNARALLQKHIYSVTGKVLSIKSIDALWRYFTGRQIKVRSKKVIADFNQIGIKLCAHCLTTNGPFETDHTVALNRGGKDEESNLQHLCKVCHERKGTRLDSKIIFIEEAKL
jgi:5-methylcytosine-specific restriction endonuclease McrA